MTCPPPPRGLRGANCRWGLCENGADSWLLYAPDVVWVYRVQGRRRGVVLCARSPQARRRRYFVPAASPAEADRILDRLYPLLPNAVFGYQPAWEPLYRAHPGRVRADLRAAQPAARAAAATGLGSGPAVVFPSVNMTMTLAFVEFGSNSAFSFAKASAGFVKPPAARLSTAAFSSSTEGMSWVA